jgi:hypothetical protein
MMLGSWFHCLPVFEARSIPVRLIDPDIIDLYCDEDDFTEREIPPPPVDPSWTPTESTSVESEQCVICKDKKKVIAAVPCGHLFACPECALKHKETCDTLFCPICKMKPLEKLQRIY